MDIKLDAFSISDKDTTLQHNALIEQTVKALNSVLDEFSKYAPNSIALTYQGENSDTNADSLITNGFWKCNNEDFASLNYPSRYGLMTVNKATSWIFQTYHSSQNGLYTRFSNDSGNTWTAWSEK